MMYIRIVYILLVGGHVSWSLTFLHVSEPEALTSLILNSLVKGVCRANRLGRQN